MKPFLILLLVTLLNARSNTKIDIKALSFELNLVAGSKAAIQWRRVFSSERRLLKYKLNTLSSDTLQKLELYLISHAADSDQPIVPGL